MMGKFVDIAKKRLREAQRRERENPSPESWRDVVLRIRELRQAEIIEVRHAMIIENTAKAAELMIRKDMQRARINSMLHVCNGGTVEFETDEEGAG